MTWLYYDINSVLCNNRNISSELIKYQSLWCWSWRMLFQQNLANFIISKRKTWYFWNNICVVRNKYSPASPQSMGRLLCVCTRACVCSGKNIRQQNNWVCSYQYYIVYINSVPVWPRGTSNRSVGTRGSSREFINSIGISIYK